MAHGPNPDDKKKRDDGSGDQGQGSEGPGTFDPLRFYEAFLGGGKEVEPPSGSPAEEAWGMFGLKPPNFSADQSTAPPITDDDREAIGKLVRGELKDKTECGRIFRLCYTYRTWAEEKGKAVVEWASGPPEEGPWWQQN